MPILRTSEPGQREQTKWTSAVGFGVTLQKRAVIRSPAHLAGRGCEPVGRVCGSL